MSSPTATPSDDGKESEKSGVPTKANKKPTPDQQRAVRRKRVNDFALMRPARASKTFANLKSRSKASGARARATRSRIQSINRNSALGPVRKFLETNAERIQTIVSGVWDIPFDFTLHLIRVAPIIITIAAIGFLWILVWMISEKIALDGKWTLTKTYDLFTFIVLVIDYLFDYLFYWLFGPIVAFAQVIACSPVLGTFGIHIPHEIDVMLCKDLPGLGNPYPIKVPPRDVFIKDYWDHLATMKTDCADFSTGTEELLIGFKLLFSPYVCPVIQHVRPVRWLSDVFYYTIGWMSWAQGTPGAYENALARQETGQRRSDGLRGNASCSAPPDALWCWIFGIGFLIIEILLPLMLILLIVVPLKRIIRASIAIVFSVFYYSVDFITYFIERVLGSLNWAGKRWAYAVVIAGQLVIGPPVGWVLYGLPGVAAGGVISAAVGGYIAAERGGEFFGGPRFGRLEVYGVALGAAIAVAVPAVGVYASQ